MKDRRDYVRIAVDLPSNQKLRGADPRAKWLYAVSVCIAGRDLTDGHVRPRVAVAEADVPARFARELTDRGAWHEPGHSCGRCPQPVRGEVYVHDYLEHQRSRAEAEAARLAGRAGAAARWKSRGNANRTGDS